MAIQKIGTHVKPTKPPKYWRSQMTPAGASSRGDFEPETRGPLDVLRGNPVELLRRQAISRLGSIPLDHVTWRFERIRIQKSPNIDRMKNPLQTWIATPDDPTSFELLHWGPLGHRLIAEDKQHQRDKEALLWAQPEPDWVGRLVSLLGLSSVA